MSATDERLVDVVAELLQQRDFDPGNHERLQAALRAERSRPRPFDLVEFLSSQRALPSAGKTHRTTKSCDYVREQLHRVQTANGRPTAQDWMRVVYTALDEACRAGLSPPELCRELSTQFEETRGKADA